MSKVVDVISSLVNTKSIVYVGASASAEKMSGMGIRNIYKSGYTGKVYAVNIKGETIEGHRTLTSIAQLPAGVQTAFITLPAKLCPGVLRELGEKKVQTAIVAVGGFSELGTDEGRRLEAELREAAAQTGMRIVGPVCNGIYSTSNHLAVGYNAVHGRTLAAGGIGLVSHSGALLAPLVAAIEQSSASLSRFFSCGSEIDINMSDYIEFLVQDNETRVIALIVDSVGNGTRFREVLRSAAAAGKPVVALKLGDSARGKQAALAHSSHLAGSGEVYRTVFREEGVISVPTLESLAVVSAVLDSGKYPCADTVTACCPSGGGGIMLVDRMTESGVEFCELAPETVQTIENHLVFDRATILNPFDLGLGGRANYKENVSALARDPGTGVLICYVTPVQTAKKRVEMAEAFASVARDNPSIPMIILFPGTVEDDEKQIYHSNKLPVVSSVLEAVAIVKAMLSLRGLRPRREDAARASLSENEAKAVVGRHGAVSESNSKELLRACGAAVCKEAFVTCASEAVEAADNIGYPVVLKACGDTLSHKSEYRLLETDIRDKNALIAAYERIEQRLSALPNMQADGFIVAQMVSGGVEVNFGITRDPEFGLVAVLGPGGVLAELIGAQRVARAMLPLSAEAIEEMIEATPLKSLLDGYRGSAAADKQALVNTVGRIADVAYSLGDSLQALDTNPIAVLKQGMGAWVLDSLLILE